MSLAVYFAIGAVKVAVLIIRITVYADREALQVQTAGLRRLRSGSVSRDTDDSIAILVGPEGGLSDMETKSAKNAGFLATRIGPRVLRTETAAATALAILQFI